MGLDTSHDAWHGSYSAFGMWRATIAKLGGFPPLEDMMGHSPEYKGKSAGKMFPWGSTLGDPRLIPLLNHSDCDGELTPAECLQIASGLLDVLPKIERETWEHDKTSQFITGCLAAYVNYESLGFY
jgi:hypothetical protein